MAFEKPNNISQAGTVSGTGAVTLGSVSESKYNTVQQKVTDGNSFWGRIQSVNNPTEHEETWLTRSGNTVTRTAISGFTTGSNGSALVNFTSGAVVVTSIAHGPSMLMMDSNGDATVARDFNVANQLKINDVASLGRSGNYTVLYDSSGGEAVKVGNASDPINYFNNDGYQFNNRAVSATFATLNATGFGLSISPTCKLHVLVDDGSPAYFGRGGSKGVRILPQSGYTAVECVDNNQATYQPIRINGSIVDIASGNTVRWEIDAGGDFLCFSDGANSLGGASNRASVVYAVTGTINTSGRESKVGIRTVIAAEGRAARRVLDGGPKAYKLKDSVDAKGDAARIHFGYVAEDVRDALEAEGLDPWAYAFLCADPITKVETYTEKATRPKVRKVSAVEKVVEVRDGRPVLIERQVERDEPVGSVMPVVGEDGRPVMVEGEGGPVPMLHFVPELEEYDIERTREVETGETRLGLRYSELEAFLRCAA